MTFGERLRGFRKKAGLTQEELAEKIGTHNITVSKWETDIALPKTVTLQALAAALGVTENDLLNDPPPETDGWVLTIRISNNNEEVLNLPKGIMPRVCEIVTRPAGGFLQLGGSYDLWVDDAKFNQLIKDIKKFRATVIQNGKAFGAVV